MLSVISRCSGQVDASNSKREYLCSIVGSCLRESGGVTRTSKVMDVLLPLGIKHWCYVKEICPRGNNKVVIIYIFMFMINVYISC